MKHAVLLIITAELALIKVSIAGGYQPGLYGRKSLPGLGVTVDL